ncbi:MAG: hypothetical protein NAOJABEB_03147 [Steroidobacteraceae bacterium]|nr:hypothetical protein [Steroidobacteraceae bacterium]
MAAPTAIACQNGFKLEVSDDASSWVDISGEGVAITLDGGEQLIGEQMTAENAFALLCDSGKTSPIGITCRTVYSEDSGGGFDEVWTRYTGSDKTLAVRFSPRGGLAGHKRYTTSVDAAGADVVPIVSCLPPALDAETAGLALFEFSVRTPALFQESIPT